MKNKLSIFLIFLIFYSGFEIYAEEKLLEIRIVNQTNKTLSKIDSLEILEITEEGLKTIQTFSTIGPKILVQINSPSPLLLRAIYKGEIYMTFIPSQEMNKSRIEKMISIYDTTKEIKDLWIHSGMQITKYEKGLEINLIYALQNKGNTTVLPDQLFFSIPESAKNLQANLSYEFSQFPIKVNLEPIEVNQKRYYKIDKAIKPGNSELIIQFEIEGFRFENSIDPIWELLNKNNKFFRVLMWKPIDIMPEIQGGTIEKKQLQNLGEAYFVYYDSKEILLDFSKGNFIYKDPMRSYKNPIFDNSLKTTFGIILGVFLLFLILGILPLKKLISYVKA